MLRSSTPGWATRRAHGTAASSTPASTTPPDRSRRSSASRTRAAHRVCRPSRRPHDRCGKVIVAAEAGEVAALEQLAAQAAANGVPVEMVDRAFLHAREPHIAGVAALWSPTTGRIEPESYVRTLARLAEAAGVAILRASSADGRPRRGRARRGDDAARVHSRVHGRERSGPLRGRGQPDARRRGVPHLHPARGEYAELAPGSRLTWSTAWSTRCRTRRATALGVHLTRTTWGTVLLGPTVRYQDGRDDYEDDRLPLEAFVDETRALLPEITLHDLQPGSSGIRAKLCPPDQPFADFLIRRMRWTAGSCR
ncbi:MAG: FAD-dependent oxidoreductase [Vicinamibacterales bacterium]